jgi:pimeloyl-ACP methyl ester carboxylesterase
LPSARAPAGHPLVLCCGLGADLDPRWGGSLPYRFGQLTLGLARVLDELGYDQVDVLGFSWGGAPGAAVRRATPAALPPVHTGEHGHRNDHGSGRPSALVTMIGPRRFRAPEYAASIVADLHGGSAHRRQSDLRDALDSQQSGGSLRGCVYQLAAGIGWTSLPFLKLIRQPTLLMGGEEDPIVPVTNARLLAGRIPHARRHSYRGGHLELITDAAELAPVVTSFLATDPAELR